MGFTDKILVCSFKAVHVPTCLLHTVAPRVCSAIVTCQCSGIPCLPPGRWLFICPYNIHSTENGLVSASALHVFVPPVFFGLFSVAFNNIFNQGKSNSSSNPLTTNRAHCLEAFTSPLPCPFEVRVLQVDSSWKGHVFLSLPLFWSSVSPSFLLTHCPRVRWGQTRHSPWGIIFLSPGACLPGSGCWALKDQVSDQKSHEVTSRMEPFLPA